MTRHFRHGDRSSFAPAAVASALLLAVAGASAQTKPLASAPGLALPVPVSTVAPQRSRDPNSTVQVVVRLADKPLVVAMGANAKRAGSPMSIAQRRQHMAMLKQKQDALSAQVKALGGTEMARVGKVHNAVVFSTKVSALPQIAKLSGVTAIRPVGVYSYSLADTVPYIGAAAAQAAGLTGAGVKVAVLDSGIDYTHKNLGGPGTAAAYAAATASPGTIPAGLYPTAKVIGGYDFVGPVWPNGSGAEGGRTEDPNPIDIEGHGTHVADIIGGKSLDGSHVGVAPGVQLYAVKVCSDVASSCNGIALIKGMDFILDPNGDLDFSDSADVVNLSLGSSYGQREDDLTEAVSNAVRFGIVAAISAGNSADRPYIVGSPSTAPEAISVAQTQVPSASTFGVRVNAPQAIAGLYSNTATLDFAPVGSGFGGNVKTAVQAGGANNLACAPLPPGSLTGFVALIDRGTCSVSLKVEAAADAGATGVLIALVAPGDAVSFSFGGGDNFVPAVVIQQSLGNAIKANIAAPVNVTVDASTRVNLIGSMVGSSSRGPSSSFSAIKPEIGAPGASLSAEVGTATGETAFGGTSGAAPMVAGSAALLLQKFSTASASEIKARLMNGANTTVYTNPAVEPGVLAPITRIGAGEVRVDKASTIETGIWDATNPYNVGLSFGTVRATGITSFAKKVAVRNHSNVARTYTIGRDFRYANDAADGAVTLTAPASISVPANSTGAFTLGLQLDAGKLPLWNLGSPVNQGNGALLQGVEYDGYIKVTESGTTVSVPWHILPHKAASVTPSTTALSLSGGSASLNFSNTQGATTGAVDVFALTGISSQLSTVLPPPGQQDVLIDLKAVGVRADSSVVQFAVSTFGPRAHPAYPAEFDVSIDTNNDGTDDYVVYTSELTGFAATGQTVVSVLDLATNTATAYYYLDADLNSANAILTAPLSALGLAPGQKFTFSVYAFDNYFTGALKDAVTGMVYTGSTPKYAASASSVAVPAGGSTGITVSAPSGGAAASPSQTGLLVLYRDGKTGRESDVVTISP